MTTKKKKLESSLEGLFSRSKDTKPVKESNPVEAPSSPAPVEKTVKSTAKKAAVKAAAEDVKTSEAVVTKAVQEEKVKPAPTEKVETAAVVEPVKTEKTAPIVENKPVAKSEPEPVIEKEPEPVVQPKPAGQNSNAALSVATETSLVAQAEDADDVQILVFKINNVAYGIDVGLVQTIIKPQAVFLVPGTVEYLKGLINLRGAVVPVIDMRLRFDLPDREADKETRFIVVEIDDIMASMVVDQVDGVRTISTKYIEKPSGLVMDIDNRYLTGIARMDDQIVLILDLLQAIRPDKVEQH
ncbi:MAG: chemotaxis protein CheW [Anaerolineae bacterium]|nr:chemotaxis protein CheW [Anaerolineae bacterium]